MKAKEQIILESLYENILVKQQFLKEGLTDNVANWIWSLVQKKFPQLAQATEKALEVLVRTKDKDQAANIIVQAFAASSPTNESLGSLVRSGISAATPYVQGVQGLVSSISDLPKLTDPEKFCRAVMHLVPDLMEALMNFVHSIGSGSIDDVQDLVENPGGTILKKVGIVVGLALLAYGTKKYVEMKQKKAKAPTQ